MIENYFSAGPRDPCAICGDDDNVGPCETCGAIICEGCEWEGRVPLHACIVHYDCGCAVEIRPPGLAPYHPCECGYRSCSDSCEEEHAYGHYLDSGGPANDAAFRRATGRSA